MHSEEERKVIVEALKKLWFSYTRSNCVDTVDIEELAESKVKDIASVVAKEVSRFHFIQTLTIIKKLMDENQ